MKPSHDTDLKPLSSFTPEASIKNDFNKLAYENNLDNFGDDFFLPTDNPGFLDFLKSSSKFDLNGKDDKEEGGDLEGHTSKLSHKENTPHISKFTNMFSPGGIFSSEINFITTQTPQSHAHQNKTAGQGADQAGFAGARNLMQSQEYINAFEDEPLSLVWSNDPFKIANQKLTLSPKSYLPQAKGQGAAGNNYFNFAEGGKKGEGYESYMDLEHAKRSTSQLSTGQPDKGSVFGKNIMETALRKRSDSFQDDDDKFDPSSDKARSSRGLRALSLKVKDIVSEKKRTSYKQVAECLIDELGQKNKMKLKEESKDEQNIKRRVYDALNVLIAADILKKQGKAVLCDDTFANIGAHRRRSMKEKKEKLEIKLFEIKKEKKVRKEALQNLVFKCMAIANLIQRNKERATSRHMSEKLDSKHEQHMTGKMGIKHEGENENRNDYNHSHANATKISVEKESPAIQPHTEDVIAFPFIVLVSTSIENSMNLNMDSTQKRLAIESSNPFHIFGDIDILLKMKLHYASMDLFKENIPTEIEKLLPKSYLDGLK